ncbi:primosomal protein N' [Patescibacteria group bacterium]
MKYAEILFQQKVGSEKHTLTYKIPEKWKIQKGQSVIVELRNRKKCGIIWEIHNNKPQFKTKNILEIVDQKPLISDKQLKLIDWMHRYYYCPLFKVLKLFIPARVFDNKPYKRLKEKNEQINRSKLLTLTKAQKSIVKKVSIKNENNFLIHGITGSGKTEIYLRLAEKEIKKGSQVLILVPEISLTPQTISYFEKGLGIPAVTIHSKLSLGERYQSWQKIWKNQAQLIIGSRSSLLSPFQNLSLIIIDEEHENSYKQEQSPRYHVHKVAEKMQKVDPKLQIIYGSATPSVETAEKFKKNTFILNERIGESQLPEIEILDLRDEFKKQNYSIFSERLQEELNLLLEKKEQAILFLNRRGSASSVVCRDCGYTESCNECEIPMTYHSFTLSSPRMICHHCGKITNPPEKCPQCSGFNIRFLGIGTQKIETDLKAMFPKMRVLRADKDTTSTKHGFSEIYKAFKNHEADVLIGTQMIAKGLHIPKVNLVGVILSDIGLNIPDFRSSERIFQLMTQVAGRAGRSKTKGKVLIQTYNPENIVLQQIQNQDYQAFFQHERTQRKILNNPPFSQLTKILIQESSLQKAQSLCQKIHDSLEKICIDLKIDNDIELNFYPAYFTRLRNKYRYIILIKDTSLESKIHKILENLSKEFLENQNIKIDIDPISIT